VRSVPRQPIRQDVKEIPTDNPLIEQLSVELEAAGKRAMQTSWARAETLSLSRR
jgi:hypothetical protein